MSLPQKSLLFSVVLAFCLEAVAAEARPRKSRAGYWPGLTLPGSVRHLQLHRAQIKLKPRKSEVPGRVLIPPSVAAKRAQRVYGGKILSVRLRGTMYVVKLRGRGHVRKVRVNAITGHVIGP